jgi:hypothetical protein
VQQIVRWQRRTLGLLPLPLEGGEGVRTHALSLLLAPSLSLPRKRGRGTHRDLPFSRTPNLASLDPGYVLVRVPDALLRCARDTTTEASLERNRERTVVLRFGQNGGLGLKTPRHRTISAEAPLVLPCRSPAANARAKIPKIDR